MTQAAMFDRESEMDRDATFSPCRKYRYTLTRTWNAKRGVVNFIMLNPSTADASEDDPTIRRCLGFARSWGFGLLIVTNLFALRSTDPAGLKAVTDPVGPGNDDAILAVAAIANLVICAWGNHGLYKGRGKAVRRMLRDEAWISCLAVTKNGNPSHPLYLPATLMPIAFPWR